MTSRDFCFWLQGFFEISAAKELSSEQLDKVKEHLGLVFEHDIKLPTHKADDQIEGSVTHTFVDRSKRLIC